jgi:tRNA(Leu) C34 or U34 (ribose-2'-O)-methylase TrmL
VKASAGATEHLLLAPVDDLAGMLTDLHLRGLRVVGSDAEASLSAREADLRGPIAIVVGSEGHGLSPAVRRRCDLFVRLPMRGAIGSLNAAVAGSILLFEALGQRDAIPASAVALAAAATPAPKAKPAAKPRPKAKARAASKGPAVKAEAAGTAVPAARATKAPAAAKGKKAAVPTRAAPAEPPVDDAAGAPAKASRKPRAPRASSAAKEVAPEPDDPDLLPT